MFSFSERVLPLADILFDDQSYRITTEKDKDDQSLQQSIAEVGLLSPPILQSLGRGPCRVVTGFRRLAALSKLQISQTTCRLLDQTVDQLSCLKIAIADNACQRSLNPAEQSRAVYKLSMMIDRHEDLCRIATGFGLPSAPSAVNKLLAVSSLPGVVFDHLSAGAIAFSTSLVLTSFEPPAAIALAGMVVDLKLGVNRQRAALELIEEISARENKSPGALLEEIRLQPVINDPEADRGLRQEHFFRYLRHRRFPSIAMAEEEFAGKTKALKPGLKAKLSPPADFEGSDYTLQLTFKNRRELGAHMILLQRIAESGLVTG